jgi:hypothetical protein
LIDAWDSEGADTRDEEKEKWEDAQKDVAYP